MSYPVHAEGFVNSHTYPALFIWLPDYACTHTYALVYISLEKLSHQSFLGVITYIHNNTPWTFHQNMLCVDYCTWVHPHDTSTCSLLTIFPHSISWIPSAPCNFLGHCNPLFSLDPLWISTIIFQQDKQDFFLPSLLYIYMYI